MPIIAIAFIVCAAVSFASGMSTAFYLHNVAALKKENRVLKQTVSNFKEALEFSQDIDDETAKLDVTNQEIINAINATVQRRKDTSPSVDMRCVSSDSLRELAKLK